MNHKKRLHPLADRPFTGSVELIPPTPKFVEFIDAHRLWGFPIQQLEYFMLEENPEHQGKKTLPPHRLMLVYSRALVILRGWRLELMVGPLINGRVARIHAEKMLGPLIIEEPWVSEIQVLPFADPNPPEFPVSSKKSLILLRSIVLKPTGRGCSVSLTKQKQVSVPLCTRMVLTIPPVRTWNGPWPTSRKPTSALTRPIPCELWINWFPH